MLGTRERKRQGDFEGEIYLSAGSLKDGKL